MQEIGRECLPHFSLIGVSGRSLTPEERLAWNSARSRLYSSVRIVPISVALCTWSGGVGPGLGVRCDVVVVTVTRSLKSKDHIGLRKSEDTKTLAGLLFKLKNTNLLVCAVVS